MRLPFAGKGPKNNGQGRIGTADTRIFSPLPKNLNPNNQLSINNNQLKLTDFRLCIDISEYPLSFQRKLESTTYEKRMDSKSSLE